MVQQGSGLKALQPSFPDLARKLLSLGQASMGRCGLCLADLSPGFIQLLLRFCSLVLPRGGVGERSEQGLEVSMFILCSPGGRAGAPLPTCCILIPIHVPSRTAGGLHCQQNHPAVYQAVGCGAGTKGHASELPISRTSGSL